MKVVSLFLPVLIFLSISCSEMDDALLETEEIGVYANVDTITFDTLLAGRTSFTKRARLFNPSEQTVELTSLSLRMGESSPYDLTINGITAKSHRSVSIRGNDSLLVLVNLTAPFENEMRVSAVRDELEWEDPLTENYQSVVLESWAVSAEEKGMSVICDELWSGQSAILISDTLVVDAGCRLTIEAGALIYFDTDAALFVAGQLTVDGSAEMPVVFRSSRMDANYKTAPGLWNGIYFLEGSKDHTIEYAIIENSQTGLRVGSPDPDTIPDIVISNSIIRHSSQFGIQAYNSDLLATNLLVYDIGFVPLFHAIGGNYQYQHATVTNFPSQLGGQEPAAVFADHIIVNEETLQDLLSVNITHSIIWGGSAESDLFLSLIDTQGQDINITNNLIFSNQEWNQNLTSDALEYVRFKDPFIFDYRLDSMSPAINGSIGSGLLIDLLGKRRDSIPDLGAYEYFNN